MIIDQALCDVDDQLLGIHKQLSPFWLEITVYGCKMDGGSFLQIIMGIRKDFRSASVLKI
jgi:uncharacterized protein YihD (DUF1040 family)